MDFGQGGRGIGSGMADEAARDLAARKAYQQYSVEAQTMGEQPMPYEQWIQMQMQQGQPQGQTPPPSQGAIPNPALMAQMLRG